MEGAERTSPVRRWLRRIAIGLAVAGAAAGLAAAALLSLDRAFPPPIPATIQVGDEVLDRDGALLRAYAATGGTWRLGIRLDEVDPLLLHMLVAYEDRRFRDHAGIDLLALGRAGLQLVANGRIVSGGSTLTMQLARLSEPRAGRSLGAKLRQLYRAWQIERRIDKDEILRRYLTLAPYGGNLEGVRAAALAWFGKEPRRLTVSEAALLVALPQLPERRRPDRDVKAAQAARDRVLARMVEAGILDGHEAERAAFEPVLGIRQAMPTLAPHLADAARRSGGTGERPRLTIDRRLQARLEAVARTAARAQGAGVSVAMVLADAATGDILASVGSADYLDPRRFGWIDMTRASRSPGSTLKPFIYGLGFEEGMIAQETLIEDRPADFGGYRPRNFDMGYQGDVTVRHALQLSLNVPAVRILDAVGPARLTARMRQAGVTPSLPPGGAPGLAIGLGGAGVTLRDLVQLYTGLANGGTARRLRDGTETQFRELDNGFLLDAAASWQVNDILSGVRPPQGASARLLAYKTGTSYGYRDAWSVGYDGGHVIGVWVGRPDSGSVPGLSGYASAAPVLFEAFEKSGLPSVPFKRPPAGSFRVAAADLPVTLQRFQAPGAALHATSGMAVAEPAPRIVFPPDGARVDLGAAGTAPSALVLKLQGGRAPFRWLANGRPLADRERRREATWLPDGAGSSTLTVIDAAGRAASVRVVVE
jgi:penicillin-binding protein 1C